MGKEELAQGQLSGNRMGRGKELDFLDRNIRPTWDNRLDNCTLFVHRYFYTAVLLLHVFHLIKSCTKRSNPRNSMMETHI